MLKEAIELSNEALAIRKKYEDAVDKTEITGNPQNRTEFIRKSLAANALTAAYQLAKKINSKEAIKKILSEDKLIAFSEKNIFGEVIGIHVRLIMDPKILKVLNPNIVAPLVKEMLTEDEKNDWYELIEQRCRIQSWMLMAIDLVQSSGFDMVISFHDMDKPIEDTDAEFTLYSGLDYTNKTAFTYGGNNPGPYLMSMLHIFKRTLAYTSGRFNYMKHERKDEKGDGNNE